METVTFPTVTGVISKVREIAAREPNKVYENPRGECGVRCYYVHGTGAQATAGCLFGHALAELGVPLSALEAIDEKVDVNVQGNAIHSVLRAYAPDDARLEETAVALQWCRTVQGEQDGGAPWLAAVGAADIMWPHMAATK